MSDLHYDLVIIGSGAGGGTLARHLAPSGKRILIVERGDWLKREKQNWDPTAVFVEDRYISQELWRDQDGRTFQPQVHYYVGGATKLYGAALYRLRREDFGELQHYKGISPAWPVSYEEFEPYYTQAEHLYQVHGARGGDPTEPPCSAPYLFPPVSHEPRIQKLADQLTAAGYHPFSAPCGVMLNEQNRAYSRCIRCNTCDGFPCLVHAKADAEVISVRPALEFSNVTLWRNSQAVRLETIPSGNAIQAVWIEREEGIEKVTADVFVVSCGATHSAKLLLMSACDTHPQGLANRSGCVGRHYMFHNSQAVLALFREPNPTAFQKTLALNDFYFGTKEFPYPMGNIQMIGKSLGPMFRGEKPWLTALVPMKLLDGVAHHAIDFWLSTEDLPDPNNRITVDREGNITLSYTKNNQVAKRKLYEKLKSVLGELGVPTVFPRTAYLKSDIPTAGVAHQAGTCRFGRDPVRSVLDVNCKAHDLDNLYVVDSSFFPSIGAVNPSLTVMANALRVGDHLLSRL